jgi:hypothetical protein
MPGIDSYTKLCLHCNGTDGSTSFPDASASAHTATANGNAHVEVDQSKFGGASGYFDGTGDNLSVPYSTDWDFGSGAFTIDFWAYFGNTGTDESIIERSDYNGGGGNGFSVQRLSNNQIRFYEGTAGTDSGGSYTVTSGQWYHIAVVKDGTNARIYLDGTQASTVSGASVGISGSPTLKIATGLAGDFNGYIDEIRVSKGTARWTANFTPPTSEYTTDSQIKTINGLAIGSVKSKSGLAIASIKKINGLTP